MTDPETPGAAGTDPWSVTTVDLFDALREYRSTERPAVVATIVDVEGSAYRRPGAKMVIDPGTESLGSITAGCLEGPVTTLAADVLEDGRPIVETFDLMDDEEWGLGLGCNGIIDILFEPLDESWDVALSALRRRESVAMLTVVESDDETVAVGSRALFTADGDRADAGEALPDSVLDELFDRMSAFREQEGARSFTVERDAGELTVFADWLTPAPELLLFGNQNDIHPVSKVGHEAGFRVTVASARGAKADAEQFPYAHHVRTARPTELADAIESPARTYAVLMSHNFIDDRLALESLLDTDVPYVGLMGPRDRFEELREALAEEEDRTLTEDELARIATPVGLDLGGGEPIHIALSIVTEALAVHNGRDGGRLKAREGPIHRRFVAPE